MARTKSRAVKVVIPGDISERIVWLEAYEDEFEEFDRLTSGIHTEVRSRIQKMKPAPPRESTVRVKDLPPAD